jgi:murein DD-endopeptidase MepM/ murein hydrolase activator NlpD
MIFKRLILIPFLTVFLFLNPACANGTLFERIEYFDPEFLPKESRVPGGIAILPFKAKGEIEPEVWFKSNRVMIQQLSREEWVAIIGLSLRLSTGKHSALLKIGDLEQTLDFEVHDKTYEAQYITLKNKAHVNPSPESLKRIREETALMKKVFASWSTQAPNKVAMSYPVDGPLSSQFGLRRFFNNQERNPHSGLDIAAPKGSEIQTPLGGTIAAVGNYYFNGNTVLIDHGQGLVSMYCHMDTLAVEHGQVIEAGKAIGTVGNTGRATGPHLHWSLNLNNTRVDPALFIENPQNNSNKTDSGDNGSD